jgi:hypothetical protein
MGKLCISMHLTTFWHPLRIAFVLTSHTCASAIFHTKQGRVEHPEPAPVETADNEQGQGKPRCI